MVSLRERKSRPSYASMAEGLANLSDEDQSENAASGSRSGSGSGSSSGSDDGSNDGTDSSVSSGDASDFQPDADRDGKKRRKKGKGRPMAKGKGRATPREVSTVSSGSAFEDQGEDEEDEDDDMEDDDDEEEDASMDVEEDYDDVVGGSPPRESKKRHQAGAGGRTIPASSYTPSASKFIPRAYQDLIKNAAKAISQPAHKDPKDPAQLKAHADRWRIPGIEGFSSGPITPFITRLKVDPRDSWEASRSGHTGVRSVNEAGDDYVWGVDQSTGEKKKHERRLKIWEWEQSVGIETPWEVWQGEGWWSDMKTVEVESESSTSGAGRPKGWKLRREVDLGLGEVGRLRADQVELLSYEQAEESFLPTPIDKNGNTWVEFQYGPDDHQGLHKMHMFESTSLGDLGSFREGFLLSAGGPIWGLDWCPQGVHRDDKEYLAISTLAHIDTQPAIGERWPSDSPGCIQIWSVSPPRSPHAGMRCEMVLCVDGGNTMEIKWMPMGANDDASSGDSGRGVPKLGIIVAVQLDGSISFYPVPHPGSFRQASGVTDSHEPVFLRLREPLLKLKVEDAACMTFDWMSGTRLGVGLSNGHIVIWDVLGALKSKNSDVLPVAYVHISQSAIRSVSAGRIPPGDSDGRPRYEQDAPYLITGSYDGNVSILDVRDAANPIDLNHQRTPYIATGFASQLGAAMYADGDYTVAIHKLFGHASGRSIQFSMHRGPVWDLASSDYHTMVASASADGSVILTNINTGWHRRKGASMTYQRLFEMDYDEHTERYRMLDRFKPESIMVGAATDRSNKKPVDPSTTKAMSWSPHSGVHRVAWNSANGLEAAGWVASGTASGLARVEWVSGRFAQGVMPGRMARSRGVAEGNQS